jgi:nucleotide-binding universal stress UspA family protein
MAKTVKGPPIIGEPVGLIRCMIIPERERNPFMNTETTEDLARMPAKSVGCRIEQQATECKLPVSRPQFKKILVAVDFSESSIAALRYATFLAEGSGATLTLVHAVEPCIYPEDLSAGRTGAEVDARWIKEHTERMETLEKTIKSDISTTVIVVKGKPWTQIVQVAQSQNADLVVIGRHGQTGLKEALMGSTGERVVRHTERPVLVVHGGRK